MTTINITETILSGNLGEGWADVDEAADVYADFLADEYRAEAERAFPDAEIEVDISVEHGVEGSAPNAIVTGDADSLDMARLEDVLANLGTWNRFLDSDACRDLA
ncbi:MAG: hypothetical protein EOM91_21865 [Sphingobacteriia bacterium]|nr:hypothetical protein [Sphingobacteriia bacterium]